MKLPKEVFEFLLRRLIGAKHYREGVVSCCVFHDEATPSMFVYFDAKHNQDWWFKCQGCGKTGPLNFLLKRLKAHHLHLPSTTTLKKQLKVIEVETFRLDSTRGLPAHYSYFRSRGITDDISREFGFKFDYAAPGAVMPVYYKHRFEGYIRRNIDSRERRYYISPGLDVGSAIWGFDSITPDRSQGIIYITEGIIDAACLWSAGHPAVALLGKNWDRKLDALHSLSHAGRLAVFSDNDRTGLTNFNKLARRLGARLCFPPSQYKDISEWATVGRNDFLQKIKARRVTA